jgi:hypothetical protein
VLERPASIAATHPAQESTIVAKCFGIALWRVAVAKWTKNGQSGELPDFVLAGLLWMSAESSMPPYHESRACTCAVRCSTLRPLHHVSRRSIGSVVKLVPDRP